MERRILQIRWSGDAAREDGAIAHQLMAWFGWATLIGPTRYVTAANRRKLAHEIGAKLGNGTAIG